MIKVLIIDDDEMIREMVADMVADMGWKAESAGTLAQGRKMAAGDGFDVIFLDVHLPDGSGLDALGELMAAPSEPEVIVITGSGQTEVAERAIRSGAWDYVQKPLTLDSVTAPLNRAATYRKEKKSRRGAESINRENIAGNGSLIRAVLDTVALAADSGASVLISGETGTGKEIFARAIHDNSARSDGPFVVVDCASLPENLVEATLFGHTKGAFTGADKAREGLVKLAHGGTLFLDEVGELPLAMQRSFLRVLEERTFRPVGAKAEAKSDFRLVAATNRDLDKMVRQDQYRKDLLFRIRSFHIELPALRERPEDIEAIAKMHLKRLIKRDHGVHKELSPDFLDALKAYHWPGNVRELVQALEMALAGARSDPTLYLKHLPDAVRVGYVTSMVRRSTPPAPGEEQPGDQASSPATGPADGLAAQPRVHGPMPANWAEYREQAVAQAEKAYFTWLLEQTGGNVRQSCQKAGVSRARLYQIMQKHGLVRPR